MKESASLLVALTVLLLASCGPDEIGIKPLVTDLYTADPSAHAFDGKIYVYPSHDIENDIRPNDKGDQFAMRDYHVYSMDAPGAEVTDHGVALSLEDIPWAKKQLWAPDAAEKDGRYYLYFPAKDEDGIFRIGVAASESPSGPFAAESDAMEGTYSIDPAVFRDDDGTYYMYFGGISGGQLQRWRAEGYSHADIYPGRDETALMPRVARLSEDMLSLAEPARDVMILDEEGVPLVQGDTFRRFFEAAWVHEYEGRYYLSYSTGDTHLIVYAVGDDPYGPFTYAGVVLNPVVGWTNHHSILQWKNRWYLFFHDSMISGGQTHLRGMKMTDLTVRSDGTIETVDPEGY